MYIAYYFDHERTGFSGIDCNELYVNGKFVSLITSVRSSSKLKDLEPRTDTEEIVLIISGNEFPIQIENRNPCPDEF